MTIRIAGSLRISANADSDVAQKVFADLTPEERERCRRFWLRFRTLERVGLGGLLLPPLLIWALPKFSARVPGTVWLVCFVTGLVCLVWQHSLDCPRCGARFSGGLVALLGKKSTWKCYGCDLSRRELKYISRHAGDLD